MKAVVLAVQILVAAVGIAPAQDYRPEPQDVCRVSTLPPIGKWMLDRLRKPADWLGRPLHGKTLREPINVILIDGVSGTPAESVGRLVRACRAAGYPAREGHSGGYWGFIGDGLFPQLPHGRGHAFANEPFEFHNNHGRFFGPFRHGNAWLYIGSFSREKFDPLTKIEHLFISFVQAREDFARRVDARTEFKLEGRVDLGNALTDHPSLTTADHDGRAAVLRVLRPPAAPLP